MIDPPITDLNLTDNFSSKIWSGDGKMIDSPQTNLVENFNYAKDLLPARVAI